MLIDARTWSGSGLGTHRLKPVAFVQIFKELPHYLKWCTLAHCAARPKTRRIYNGDTDGTEKNLDLLLQTYHSSLGLSEERM
jgi:hypothetical protein